MKEIWVESMVRDDPNDRGANGLFVITYSEKDAHGKIRRYRKKSCALISHAEKYDTKGATLLYIGFECVDLEENTEEIT